MCNNKKSERSKKVVYFIICVCDNNIYNNNKFYMNCKKSDQKIYYYIQLNVSDSKTFQYACHSHTCDYRIIFTSDKDIGILEAVVAVKKF